MPERYNRYPDESGPAYLDKTDDEYYAECSTLAFDYDDFIELCNPDTASKIGQEGK